MAKRKSLQELTIKDNFMFGAVVLDPNNCKEVIERILYSMWNDRQMTREKMMMPLSVC